MMYRPIDGEYMYLSQFTHNTLIVNVQCNKHVSDLPAAMRERERKEPVT
jgi:hypothetical protein